MRLEIANLAPSLTSATQQIVDALGRAADRGLDCECLTDLLQVAFSQRSR